MEKYAFLLTRTICQKMFCFLHTVGKYRLESLSTWVTRNGVTERMYGNTKHSPHNAMSSEHVRFLAGFIKNIASTYGLPLPGRLPNHEQKVLLLPSDMSTSLDISEVQDSMLPGQFLSYWQE